MSSKKTSKKSSKTKKEKKVKKEKTKKESKVKKVKKEKTKKEKKVKTKKKEEIDVNEDSITEDLELSEYKVSTEVSESIVETEECLEISDDESNEIKIVDPKDRITRNFLTKYEAVRIIGERTKQLVMGAKPLISNHHEFSYEQIALEELKLNMIPFKIRRPIGNKYEIWNLNELRKDHLQSIIE